MRQSRHHAQTFKPVTDMKIAAVATLTAASMLLGACAMLQSDDTVTPVDVEQVARSNYCGSPDAQTRANLFPDAASLRLWSAGRGVEMLPAGVPENAAYAVIEIGERRTGGYGLAISNRAELKRGVLTLTATFFDTPQGVLTQAITSPCLVVRLPGAGVRVVEVRDPAGELRASSIHQ
jgi:hypothetical protein